MMKESVMLRKMQSSLIPACLLVVLIIWPVSAQEKPEHCFTAEARATAERSAKVWQEPDPDYDPVTGLNSTKGVRSGALPVDSNGLAMPVKCVAHKDLSKGAGTTPKFHCAVPGVV